MEYEKLQLYAHITNYIEVENGLRLKVNEVGKEFHIFFVHKKESGK
jgi:hypothetical protein